MKALNLVISSGWLTAIIFRLLFLFLFSLRLVPTPVWTVLVTVDELISYPLFTFLATFRLNPDQFIYHYVLMTVTVVVLLAVNIFLHFKVKKHRFLWQFLASYLILAPLFFFQEYLIGQRYFYEYFN